MTKVTVVIQTYNRPAYLPAAIKSVLNQTFQDFEIIIFDSGSNYDIRGLIAGFGDPRITLQASDKAIDSAANFRRILTYKYDTEYMIAFHDDDMMHPQLIERELALIERNKELVWVGTSLEFFHNQSQIDNFKLLSKLINFQVYDWVGLTRLVLNNFHLAYNTVMYRTAILEDMDVFREKYSKWSDRPFLIHLSKKGKVAIIKEKLVNYRMHHGQDSQVGNDGNLSYLLNLCEYYKDNLPTPLDNADRKLFYSWSSNNLILALAGFSNNFKGYWHLVRNCRKNGLIKFRYLDIRGIWYLFKVFRKYLLTN